MSFSSVSRCMASPSRVATTQVQSAVSSGCPMPRSVAIDMTAMSSAMRTPESRVAESRMPRTWSDRRCEVDDQRGARKDDDDDERQLGDGDRLEAPLRNLLARLQESDGAGHNGEDAGHDK